MITRVSLQENHLRLGSGPEAVTGGREMAFPTGNMCKKTWHMRDQGDARRRAQWTRLRESSAMQLGHWCLLPEGSVMQTGPGDPDPALEHSGRRE